MDKTGMIKALHRKPFFTDDLPGEVVGQISVELSVISGIRVHLCSDYQEFDGHRCSDMLGYNYSFLVFIYHSNAEYVSHTKRANINIANKRISLHKYLSANNLFDLSEAEDWR